MVACCEAYVFLKGLQIVRNLDGQTDPRLDQSETSQVLEQGRGMFHSCCPRPPARCPSSFCRVERVRQAMMTKLMFPLFFCFFPGLSSSLRSVRRDNRLPFLPIRHSIRFLMEALGRPLAPPIPMVSKDKGARPSH